MKFSTTLIIPLTLAASLVVGMPTAAPADDAQGFRAITPRDSPVDSPPTQPDVDLPQQQKPEPPAQPDVDFPQQQTPDPPAQPDVDLPQQQSPVDSGDLRKHHGGKHPHVARIQSQNFRGKICNSLRVQASDNALSGWISSQVGPDGVYHLTKNKAQALKATYKDHYLTPLNGGPGFPFVGGTFGKRAKTPPGVDNFEGNSSNYALITRTGFTRYKSSAQSVGSSFNTATRSNQHVEAAVFTMGENNEILPVWYNTDRSPRPSTFGVGPNREIVFSANVGEYIALVRGGKSARIFCE